MTASTAARGTRRMRPALLVAAAAVLAAGYVAAVDPEQPGHYPTCPVLAVTGWACPGCGSLRAVHALAHADPVTALQRNPLTVLLIGVLVLLWFRWVLRLARGGQVRRSRDVPTRLLVSVVVLVAGFGVLRNLPGVGWLGP